MIVPNYIPDPIEVPGNVTEETYDVRLRFIRKVTLLHVLGMLGVTGLVVLPWPAVGVAYSAGVFSALLFSLDLMRIARRGQPSEAVWSARFLPLLLLVAAWFSLELKVVGFPVWSLLIGPVFALLYTFLCGKDYSFIGCLSLCLIGSSVTVASLSTHYQLSSFDAGTALILNACYLTYFVYDLASLMARRRKNDALAAVVDLYRDVFNIFGYIFRVLRHWKKHRIWAGR